MALRSVSQVCVNGPAIQTSGGQFLRHSCQSLASASNFPQLRDGKVEDGYQIASLGGSFMIGGPGMSNHVPFNPQQNFNHPTTGQLIYKHETGVLTGIASILNPLASAGANIFAAQQQINTQRAMLRAGAMAPPPVAFIPPPPPRRNNSGIIIAVVVVVVVAGGLMMMSGNKN